MKTMIAPVANHVEQSSNPNKGGIGFFLGSERGIFPSFKPRRKDSSASLVGGRDIYIS